MVSVTSFGNQLVMANLFGASVLMDIYLIAASLPFLVSGTLSAVLSYSMVPALISYKSDQDAYRWFAGIILFALSGTAVLIFIGGYLTTPAIVQFFGARLSHDSQTEAVLVARVSWAAAACSILLGYLGTMHNAAKRFYLPVLTGLLPYVGMILFGIVAGSLFGPVAIAWGMLAGTVLGCLVLLKGAFHELDFSRACLTYWPQAVKYFTKMPIIILSMSCFTAFQTIDAYWAPLIGVGNLSYLGYCQRILVAIGSLVIAGPSVVLVPRLAEAHIEERQQEFLNDLGTSIRMVLVFVVPAVIAVSFLSSPLIELVFQRGAFNEEATEKIASLLPIMMVGMVAMVCVVIMFRALYSRQQVLPAALLGAMVLVLYFILSGTLSRLMTVQGIAIAYAVSWWVTLSGAIAFIWKDNMKSISSKKIMIFPLKLIGTVIIMSTVMYAFSALWILPLNEIGYLKLSFRTVTIGAVGLIIYYFTAAKLFSIPEILYLYDQLLRGCKAITL